MASLRLELRANIAPCAPASSEDAGKVREVPLAGQPSEPSRGAPGAPPASAPWRARTPSTPSNRPSRFASLSRRPHRFLHHLTKRHPYGPRAVLSPARDNLARTSSRVKVFVFFQNIATLVLRSHRT